VSSLTTNSNWFPPLSSPAKKVILSNVPPFISDKAITNELSRYGRLVSPIKRIPLGCKSSLVKHLVSFRRMVYMVFKEGTEELNVVFKFSVDGFDYNIFVYSDADIKCFKCGKTGHLVRACPERQSDPGVSERPGQEAAEPAVVVPPAATVRPAAEGPGVVAAPEQTESEPQAQPAAQKPTGATITPEEPCVAEPVMVKSCSAELVSLRHGDTDQDQEKPCLTEPDLERPCSVDSGKCWSCLCWQRQAQRCRAVTWKHQSPHQCMRMGEMWRWKTSPLSKYQLRERKKYTLNVTRDIVRYLKALEIEIVELQRLEATGNRGHIEALKSKNAKMNDLLDITARGALVRSRFTSVTEMDAPSKFFFSLEQKNGQKRFIHAVRTESGDLLSDPTEIHKQTVCFYSKLYSSERSGAQIVEESFLKDLPKLSEQVARELDRELTLAELHKALQGMENERAPGIDGLSVEFYKAFWAVIGQDVLEVLRDSMNVGQLPLSCRRAVLTLLPKKGDLTHLKNWRPVSLLCTDIKLLSKALASRLTKVMEQITHQDQSYCVPDRSIFDNIYFICDILDVSRLLGLQTGLIFLDQEKAFDRVEHEYLWKVLETFGFNPGFIAMVKVFYCEIESVLKVNGGLCAPFKVLRGIRQGLALSGHALHIRGSRVLTFFK
ncbi:hypothetical protein QTP70_014376, partial [Hemibagrus guttatus]